MALTDKLTAIADAIRRQLGTTTAMTPAEMPTLIDSIGIGVIPDYWKSYLEAKATEINTALTAAGENKSAFLWYTDAHWTTNYGKSPMILKYLSQHTGISKTFFGGDIATSKSGEIDAMTAWQGMTKGIPNHHSVIGNHDIQVTELPTVDEYADYFIMSERTGDMAVGTLSGRGKLFYYIDNHVENTRYICLSTGTMWTNADEVAWCIEALNSTPQNWHIVIISHLWLNNDYNNGGAILTTPVDYTQGYLDMFDAYNYRLSGVESFTNTPYAFTNAQGKIEFIIGGHVHRDYDFTTARGIPVVLTECDSYQERSDTSVAKKGTTTENCVYAIVADYDARKVKIINVGRGNTRSVEIPHISLYTNVLDSAGYTTNTRISVSSGDFELKTETGWCASGLIPAVAGDVISLKNCTFTKSTTASTHRGGVYGANADGTYSGQMCSMGDMTKSGGTANPVYDTDGDNIIQFNVPSNIKSPGYIRIVVQNFNENSIVTVNEEIG